MRKVNQSWLVMQRLQMQLGKPHDDCMAMLKYLDESEQRTKPEPIDAVH